MEIVAINQISPDQVIFWQWGFITINATLVYTWLIMGILVIGFRACHPQSFHGHRTISRWQNLLEVIVSTIRSEIREIAQEDADKYLPFIGTLFLFILLSNLLTFVPGYVAPTSSLTTTAALAICVFIAVPILRHHKAGVDRISQGVLPADVHLLPLPCHGGIFPDPGPGRPALRQHHEPREGHRASCWP